MEVLADSIKKHIHVKRLDSNHIEKIFANCRLLHRQKIVEFRYYFEQVLSYLSKNDLIVTSTYSMFASYQYIMQTKRTLGNNYHLIIKLQQQPHILISPQILPHKNYQRQKLYLHDSHSLVKRTLTEVFSIHPQKQTSEHIHIQTQTSNYYINPAEVANKTGLKQQTKYGQLKKTKDTEREGRAQSSIINDLIALSSEVQRQSFKSKQFNGLESIQCIECTSIHDGDSYNFQQDESEIISLTNEQKEFFHNFVTPETAQNKQLEELFHRLSLQTKEVVVRQIKEVKSLPSNKMKVIRNFFKPKEATAKDEKKESQSIAFLQELIQKMKGSQFINSPSLPQNWNNPK